MKPTAAGVALIHNGRLLLLHRRPNCDAGGCWAYPGGRIEAGETPQQAAVRELREETNLVLAGDQLFPLGITASGFQGFAARVDQAIEPTLNDEHTDWLWAPFDALPSPLHPHLSDQLRIAVDPDGWVADLVKRLRK